MLAPAGAVCRWPSAPGGPVPRGDGRHRGSPCSSCPRGPALERPGPALLVPVPVPAGRAWRWPRSARPGPPLRRRPLTRPGPPTRPTPDPLCSRPRGRPRRVDVRRPAPRRHARLAAKPTTTDPSFIPDWAKWNYSGYERKDGLSRVQAGHRHDGPRRPHHGCGRAHWEYESALDRFGTPMALMLLPYWTDGCIGSMEGLYFESSATTPYHFLSAAELSKAPSNPQRDLPYTSLDLAAGVEHLQMLGARYYLAFSPEAIAQAAANPDLTLVARPASGRSTRWRAPSWSRRCAFEPAVVKGVGKGERAWMAVRPTGTWTRRPRRVPGRGRAQGVAAGGGAQASPASQDRSAPASTVDDRRAAAARPGASATSDQRRPISFDVDKPGSPVLVKASYFPNWKARGPGPVAGDAQPHGGHPHSTHVSCTSAGPRSTSSAGSSPSAVRWRVCRPAGGRWISTTPSRPVPTPRAGRRDRRPGPPRAGRRRRRGRPADAAHRAGPSGTEPAHVSDRGG